MTSTTRPICKKRVRKGYVEHLLQHIREKAREILRNRRAVG